MTERAEGPPVELRILDPRLREWGMPAYQSEMAAAIDLHACIDAPVLLHPASAPVLISSGIAMHIADPGLAAVVLRAPGLATAKASCLEISSG